MSSPFWRFLVLPFLLTPVLAAAGCSDSGGTPTGAAGISGSGEGVVGVFSVNLKSDFPPPAADVVGFVRNAPLNELVVWEEKGKDGSCALLKPRVPFCSTPCGGGNECVEDDKCKPEPTNVDAGVVTIAGIKTTAGATTVQLSSPLPGTYSTATSLAFPPFDEGADVSFSVASGPYGAFSAHAKGIAPLVVPDTTLSLDKDKPLALTWTAKGASADSKIHVHLDISHHGGTKGAIECDAADTGSLTIGASLVTQLVNLGVAGFPTVKLTRNSVGSAKISLGTVEMRAEHSVERAVVVAGHTSCTEDTQCPTGQTCQVDLQCK